MHPTYGRTPGTAQFVFGQLPCYLSNGGRRSQSAACILLATSSESHEAQLLFLRRYDVQQTPGRAAASATMGRCCRQGPTMLPTGEKLTTPGRTAGSAGSPYLRTVRLPDMRRHVRPRVVHFACRSVPSRRFAHAATMARSLVCLLSLLAVDSAWRPTPMLRPPEVRSFTP
jgi:hypothetical protein